MTFHSACGRILRREAERLGYRSNFTIYDQADQVRARQAVPRGARARPEALHAARHPLADLEREEPAVSPAEYAERVASFYDQTVADVYDLYQRRLFASNAVDFDDMLLLTVDVLERFPDAREKWQDAFRYVLVDEYQDTNHAQYRLLQLLAEKHQNLFAVGDPDQCLVAGTLVTMADGTTKPIEEVVAGDEVLSCYGSGRFGPARVPAYARLDAARGNRDHAASRPTDRVDARAHALRRLQGRADAAAHMTYLMWKRGAGFRVGTSRTYTNGQRSRSPGRRCG